MSSDVEVQEKETIVLKENTDHEEKASNEDVTKAIDNHTHSYQKREKEKTRNISRN